MKMDSLHVACTAIGKRIVIAHMGKDKSVCLNQQECEGEVMTALVEKFLEDDKPEYVHKFTLCGVPYELSLKCATT